MKKSRFSEHQIIGILKQGEAGIAVVDTGRERGNGKSTYYEWMTKFGARSLHNSAD